MPSPMWFFPDRSVDWLFPRQAQRMDWSRLEIPEMAAALSDLRDPDRIGRGTATPGFCGRRSGCWVQPQGENGVLPARRGIDEEAQEWRELYAGRAWLGWERSAGPPGPDDLLRPGRGGGPLFAGHDVTLLDGRTWHVPMIRRITENVTSLPVRLGMTESRELVRSIHPVYCEIYERCMTLSVAILEDSMRIAPELVGPLFEFACDALALNYRVDIRTVTELGLLDRNAVVECYEATADVPFLNQAGEAAKKNGKAAGSPTGPTRESTPSNSGDVAGSPTTPLRSPSSTSPPN